jgi:hypothetical protein
MELLEQVRLFSPATLRYIMTGDPLASEIKRAKEEGLIHQCLAKPFRLKEMEETIDTALELFENR